MQANVVDKSTGIMDVRNRSVILGALTLIVIVGLFWDGIVDLISTWDREEYSHGYLVPPIAVFLLLRGLANTSPERDHSSWSGVIVCLFAVALGLLGILGKIPDLVQYGLIIALVGLFGVQVGWRSLLKLWAPFMCLGFIIPLPQFIYLKLSAFMQLISSELGVAFIRWIGIPVFLEGNVIDLGVYQLQVAEACNGLRYLFPLMSFGFLFAVLYSGPWWHRTILFLATIPITIIINSFRIGMIGVLVDGYGIEQAEGFLHYFEGWIIFVACVALLFGTAYLLSRLGRLGKPLGEILDFGTDNLSIGAKRLMGSTAIGPHIAVCALFLVILIGLHTVPQKATVIVDRRPFVTFPGTVDQWRGNQVTLSPEILAVLEPDDYLMANYVSDGGKENVNLYMAYYANQTDGRAVHSPEVCIPGGGWEISSLDQVALPVGGTAGAAVTLSRAVIQKGTSRQLVYFWFEGRGRQLTNEYLVKWYILMDGLTSGRSDGSLVRLATAVHGADGLVAADKRLTDFLGLVHPKLSAYIPS